MKLNTALAAILAGTLGIASSAAEAVTIEVGYPYSALFDVTFERIYPLFKKAHPDIDVKFRATYDNYEDATNTILREAVADKMPDVTFQGLNRQAALVEKGIAKSLEPFIAKEQNFSKEGYHQAMLDLGTFGGKSTGFRSRSRCRSVTTTWMRSGRPEFRHRRRHGTRLSKIAGNCVPSGSRTPCSGAGTSPGTGSSRP